jgi:hypothetical protein
MRNNINFKKVVLATLLGSTVFIMSGCSSWWGNDSRSTTNTQYQNTQTSTDYKGER